ncbi:PREDICTED: interferon-related developmental regulator 1 [Papilio xuthus]|uniref:Interferon-related developmental regulator 1 n=1 Tax=Papilio xuthus TaxID=66420 RepID=A0A194QDV1_PAPXU|nr:PREDICTED: interferon-related developmental regulator 1 [Papilio xuthus]KPJ01641.1 Interferon-related developmental regulator 1 [Papilio xuthus]
MPKGKKKGKYEHKRTEQAYSSDEDAGIDMTIDNCSEISGQSDLKSNHEDAENDVQEKLEEKVLELIEALNARANAARAAALVSLQGALQRRYLAGLLANHRATLADHISRTLRRGRDGERRAAANVAPLLALQIGEEGTEEFMKEVRPALFAACTDKSASLETRTDCCSSLAVLCYLLEDDLTEIIEILRMYESIFSGSYLKGDSSVKVSGAAVEEGLWHAAALDGWALLFALAEPAHAAAMLRAHPPSPARLLQLLEACNLEVRMAAGGALAVAHERSAEDEVWAAGEAALLARLAQLARDPHKYRAKRDRKLQRATFRDILKYFEEDEVPELSVRVGSEAVVCDTWGARAAYAALAGALGGGLRALAPHCAPLRHALALPASPPLAPPPTRQDKLQRHLQNNAACKARTLARNKSRDKRSAALAL